MFRNGNRNASETETERFRNGNGIGYRKRTPQKGVRNGTPKPSCKLHLPDDRFYVSVIGDVANRGDVESVTVTPPL